MENDTEHIDELLTCKCDICEYGAMPERELNNHNTQVQTKLVCLSWNIEGVQRNIYNLIYVLDSHKPQLVFLSEPQMFQHDLNLIMKLLVGMYT